MIESWRRREVLVLPGLLLLAAALRLPDLATRGTWDADQGAEMLVLRAMVRDGAIPLLGPTTQLPGLYHGALYYYLLAPAAALTGGDSPLAVVACIALAGIAAVGVTWWLARSIGGPVAGLVAGLAMAISPSAIEASTFIWNPNFTAFASAVALAGAWRAWTSRHPAWWLLSALGATVAMQCHILGVILLPVIGALGVADVRRRTGGLEHAAVIRAGLGGLAIVALGFVPMIVHGLTSGFTEPQGILDFLRTGGDTGGSSLPGRLPLVASRTLSWPLVGLITTSPAAAAVSVGGVVAIIGWRAVAAFGPERVAVRWLGLALVWSAIALSLLTPSLGYVIAELPTDHYHAFADPMVFVLVGVGVAALWRSAPGRGAVSAISPGRILASAAMLAIVTWAGLHQPPAVAPDGGFPAAEAAAARIESVPGVLEPIEIGSLPIVKGAEAYAYPLVRDGRIVVAANLDRAAPVIAGETLVVVCDSLFEEVIGAPCGGGAEAAVVPTAFGSPRDRFKAAPRQVISVYQAPQGDAVP